MAKQTKNPFLDWDMTKLTDMQKLSEQFAVAGVDAQVLMDAQRKNLEALTAANRAAYEGAQAIAQRQAEIMREFSTGAIKATSELASGGTPQDQVAKQADIMKQNYEAAVANLRELSEMNAKTGADIVDMLNKRVTESLDEMKKVVKSGS